MGDIADMMLEGQMCQWCGEILDDGDGYPVVCAGCQSQHKVDQYGDSLSKPKPTKKIACYVCGKKVHPIGMKQHCDDKHEGRHE